MTILTFRDIRYKSVVLLSIFLFAGSYILDIVYGPTQTELLFLTAFGFAILIAAFWAILNYIDHLRINPLYTSHRTVNDFIRQLSISEDEKLEIRSIMLDYIEDQVEQGKEPQLAEKEIIQQFQLEKLQKHENDSLFYLHKHRYLLLYSVVLLAVGILALLFNNLFPALFWVILEATAICFGCGFLLTYLMYQFLNKLLIQK